MTILHFVHGKYEGQEFPLDGAAFIAGRSTEADLVLADDSVSRKHARFYARRGRIWVRDLGSRNGTVINGQMVDHHCLRPGDRVVLGSSLARVEQRPRAKLRSERAGEQRRKIPSESSGRSMTGTIEDIPLTDVLQWLATSRKTGALKVKDADAGRLGALHLRDGQVFYAAISGSEGMHPGKALRRMLAWQKGTFELDNAVIQDPPVEISMSLEHMLMEAARQQDELAALVKRSSLPGPQSEIRLIKPSPVRWKDLEPTQLDVMQDLAEWGSWATVLDRSEHEDLTLYRALVQLHKQGVVEY